MFKRLYKLNENIFEILTKDSSYWLGFFSGDGNISENKIRICLSDKDYSHIQKWKKFTGWTGKEYHKPEFQYGNTKYISRSSTEISFRSTKIKNDLAKFGIIARKTYLLRFPTQILISPYLRDYIRGYFDADGCISQQIRKLKKPSGKIYIYLGGEFSIEGNNEFLKVLQEEVFCKELSLPCTSRKYKENIKRIRYGGIDQLAIIYHFLYDNSELFLKRKKKIFSSILLHRQRLSEQTPKGEATVRTIW